MRLARARCSAVPSRERNPTGPLMLSGAPALDELIQSSPPACFNTGSFNAALTTFGGVFLYEMKLQRRHLRLPRCGMGYGSPSRAALREASGISTPANEDGRVLSLQYRVTLSYSTVMQQSRSPRRGPQAPTAQAMGVSSGFIPTLTGSRPGARS